MADTVNVDLPNAIIDKGTAYGPGKDIPVPREVADKYDLGKAKAEKAEKAEKPKKK